MAKSHIQVKNCSDVFAYFYKGSGESGLLGGWQTLAEVGSLVELAGWVFWNRTRRVLPADGAGYESVGITGFHLGCPWFSGSG